MAKPKTNTILGYMYRDAGNYKRFKEIVFEGELDKSEMSIIERTLGEQFEPSDYDLPHLNPTEGDDDYDEELDHPYHEFSFINLTSESPDDERGRTARDLFELISPDAKRREIK